MDNVWFCRIEPADQWVPLLGGAVTAALIAVAAAVMVTCATRCTTRRAVAVVAVCGAVFQVGHFSEHGIQAMGLALTTHDVTLTWWARQIGYGYAWILHRDPHIGNEAMHFFGDWVYTSGWLAWRKLYPDDRFGRVGSRFQYAHQFEHCLLFPSALLLGRPYGLTTLAGEGPVWLRISIHFVLNFTGSLLWVGSAVSVFSAVLVRRGMRMGVA